MHIRSLSLENFRTYTRLELECPPGPILLCGSNAQGKTSLLEAIYCLSTGHSPLTHVDRHLINWTAAEQDMGYARLRAEVVSRSRALEIALALANSQTRTGAQRLQKQIRIDRQVRQPRHLTGCLNVVLFLPQDIDLVAGPPAGRRRYLDDTLAQVDADYSAALDVYREALRQRNALLRHLAERGGDASQLDPLDARLARSGVVLCQSRRRLIADLSRYATRIHSELTGGQEWLKLEYHPNFDPALPPGLAYQMPMGELSGPPDGISADDLVNAFRAELDRRRKDEIARGMTLTGPHRDEMRFTADGVDLGTFGSRGQQRTAVLALKMAQREWMTETAGEPPVLLLDEVLAELDMQRRAFLLAQVGQVEQALLTATDPTMFGADFLSRALLLRVERGIVGPYT
ncbi:MAG: DNA replication/repair protein RecF [Anaerolineae bacterium]|nr:DNA replication/repair protein RecF [Anaerolineae bacterium]